ncbi:hypothetical protein TM48_01446 [Mycobacterium shottsii]|uniref:Uncharacterized protein n=1 Tax=Mycobacterium shottsii TaxID=133549 RepID=A0A7I7LBS9_9MYCO|nr:hypothetical protein [Mycobacterium shottsii]QYL27244.1 hypothetical protein TM48_01446 [Mycobacterium shottsii]BBX56962.1 hypothetical protein MSHO_23070 [Mycobacterium shottsii]
MSTEIYTARPPDDTIVVIPTSLEFVYEHANGNDVLCLLMDTKRHGPMLVALTPDSARHVAAHLHGMLGQLDELRHEHNERNK